MHKDFSWVKASTVSCFLQLSGLLSWKRYESNDPISNKQSMVKFWVVFVCVFSDTFCASS